jgi:hypothetical protein
VLKCRDFAPRMLPMITTLAGFLCSSYATVSCAQSMNDTNDPCATVVSTAEMSDCFDSMRPQIRVLRELTGVSRLFTWIQRGFAADSRVRSRVPSIARRVLREA